jgi:hypothetical protein
MEIKRDDNIIEIKTLLAILDGAFRSFRFCYGDVT